LGNLAAFHSPLGDRVLYRTLVCGDDAAKGCGGGMFMTLRKYISQSIVSAGYFAHGLTAFERIMPSPEG
jgi:hypothetical protein